jgi:hypothetical protein
MVKSIACTVEKFIFNLIIMYDQISKLNKYCNNTYNVLVIALLSFIFLFENLILNDNIFFILNTSLFCIHKSY